MHSASAGKLRKQGSIVTNITPELEIPPTLIVHGTKDRKVNTRMSVELFEKLRACGKDTELYRKRACSYATAA